jgi:hypothetical protein
LTRPRNKAPISLKLGDIGKGAIQKIYPSGLREIYRRILQAINDRGIIGVFVNVDPSDIGAGDVDQRAGRRDLTFVVVISVVKEVRTVSLDAALAEKDRVNNPRDAYLREGSPVKPVGAAGDGGPNLLDKKALDAYALRLNQEPGMQVDIAISGTSEAGSVRLDYLVTRGGASVTPGGATRPASGPK